MAYVAVDLGGSHATCGLVNRNAVLAREYISVSDNRSLGKLLPELERSLHGLLADLTGETCEGMAFSFCGIVDSSSRRIVESNGKYLDALEIDLPQWARSRFNLPLEMENDARAALLGEWTAGAARGWNDVVMITLGTGVGGAAMIDGKLLRGKHSQAGCLLGHFVADLDGHPCSCGNIGCVEAEASTWSLRRLCSEQSHFRESPLATLPEINFKHVFSFAECGDSCAVAVLQRCMQVWAASTVSWIHAYDPEVIVFGGGVMSAAEAILPAIASYVDRHAWTPWGKVKLRKAELGSDAPLFAGAALFSEKA